MPARGPSSAPSRGRRPRSSSSGRRACRRSSWCWPAPPWRWPTSSARCRPGCWPTCTRAGCPWSCQRWSAGSAWPWSGSRAVPCRCSRAWRCGASAGPSAAAPRTPGSRTRWARRRSARPTSVAPRWSGSPASRASGPRSPWRRPTCACRSSAPGPPPCSWASSWRSRCPRRDSAGRSAATAWPGRCARHGTRRWPAGVRWPPTRCSCWCSASRSPSAPGARAGTGCGRRT